MRRRRPINKITKRQSSDETRLELSNDAQMMNTDKDEKCTEEMVGTKPNARTNNANPEISDRTPKMSKSQAETINSEHKETRIKDRAVKNQNEFFIPIGQFIENTKDIPEPVPIWRGIIQGTVGFVFGPAKTGKTIFCETFGMSCVAGDEEFFGEGITPGPYKVLFISLEENWQLRKKRNLKQISTYSKEKQALIEENYYVADIDMPYHIDNKDLRRKFQSAIIKAKADIVIIDSLSHLIVGKIEESKVATELFKYIKDIAYSANITLILIHHTPKQKDESIRQESIAGSRVLGAGADFAYGLKSLSNECKYFKDVINRYGERNKKVLTFDITQDSTIQSIEETDENTLLQSLDRRYDPTNKIEILKYVEQKCKESDHVETKELLDEFMTKKGLGERTVKENLYKLVKEEKLKQPGHGKYSVS